jgi:hypothetical protein
MAAVFLSFANQDRDFAQSLRKHLSILGHKVWSFDEQLTPGERWQDAIIARLKEVDALVVIVSANSSRSTWIYHELGAAVAYARERGRPIIAPVVLGDVELPAQLAQFQGVFSPDANAEEVALKLAEGLERLSGIQLAKEERQKEVQQHVESSAAIYIQKSLDELKARENTYQRWAYVWYSVAYVTLLVTVAFGVWRVLVTGPGTITWPALVELAVTGVVVVGLLIALAKYAFSLGKSFMVEALRNADRRHAISFGEFYLRARGASIDWAEVKDAFQHWNIDKGSQFIGQQASDLDPQVFALAVEFARAVIAKEKAK